MTMRVENERASFAAADQVARALGLWADPDGTVLRVDENGIQKRTRHIVQHEDLTRAQAYAVYLYQQMQNLLLVIEAAEMGKLGLTAKETLDAIAS